MINVQGNTQEETAPTVISPPQPAQRLDTPSLEDLVSEVITSREVAAKDVRQRLNGTFKSHPSPAQETPPVSSGVNPIADTVTSDLAASPTLLSPDVGGRTDSAVVPAVNTVEGYISALAKQQATAGGISEEEKSSELFGAIKPSSVPTDTEAPTKGEFQRPESTAPESGVKGEHTTNAPGKAA